MEDQAVTTDFRDQRVGLIIFGALGIIAGIFSGLFCLLYVAMLAGLMGDAARPPLATFVQVMGFYGGAGIAFVWLGIGSILCRRWASSLIVAGAWLWLACGVMGLAVLLAMHGYFDQAMAQALKDAGSEPRPGLILAIKMVMFSFFTAMYLIVPAALVAFYGRRAVSLTCEARDPIPRWTDGIPVPALIAAVMLSLFAFGLVVSASNPGWPFFTALLKGPAAHVAALLQGVLLGFAAWGAFRLKSWAWWLGLILPVLMMISFAVFMRTAGMATYFDTLGFNAQQRKAIEGSPFLDPGAWDWLMIAYPLAFSGFMLWVKRYFRGAVTSPGA